MRAILLIVLIGLVSCASHTSQIVIKANELQTLAVKQNLGKAREEAIINFAIDVARYHQKNQDSRIKVAWKELKFNLGTIEEPLKPTWNELDKLIDK